MPSLFDDYIADAPELRDFFATAYSRLFDSPGPVAHWAPALLAETNRFNEALDHPGGLTGTETLIITGQQPGLFTGPLYTIFKAVSAIRLARTFTERTGAPCAPVFWIGADDHDFEEVRTAHLLTRNHESLALRYAPEQDVSGQPLYQVPLSPMLHTLIDEAANQSTGSEFTRDVAAFLHASLDASSGFTDWFARIMARLFHDTPLRFFAPYQPEARAIAARVIEQEIREPLITTRLVNEAGQRLTALGYTPQVVKGENECAFFIEVNGRRRKVLFEEDHFHLPEEGRRHSREEMLALLHESPGCFSPNVVLRCVVRQAVLPVAAYVAGPGEVGYWAQTKPLFEHFGQPMPVVYPRLRAFITTAKLKKLMTKFSLAIDDLSQPEAQLVERAMRSAAPHPALGLLETRRATVNREMESLLAEIQGLRLKSESPLAMATSAAEQIASALDRLERGITYADTVQAETIQKQVHRLCTALAPERRPQERHYTVFSFLFEQGWEFIPRLIRLLDEESFTLQEVEL